MLLAAVGESVPLHLVLADGNTTFFPRARVYDGGSLITTVDLVHVSGGYYVGAWTPAAAGKYVVVHSVYTDGTYVTLASRYRRGEDEVTVLPFALTGEQGVVRASVTLDSATNTITVNTWLEVDTAAVTSGLTTATLVLYTSAGASLSTPPADPAPDGNGVFLFAFPPPVFAIGETPTYLVGTIVRSGRTYRGVTGVTFSRAA